MKLDRFGNFSAGLAILQKHEGDKTIISDGSKILVSGEGLRIENMDALHVGWLVQRDWIYPGDPNSATPNWGFDAPARG